MRITLIRSPETVRKFSTAAPAVPPIGLAYVAANLLREGHEVQFIDAIGLGIDRYSQINDLLMYRGLPIEEIVERVEDPGMIGVATMFSQDWPEVRALIDALRSRFPGVPIVAGGEHVTAAPEFCMQDAAGLDFIASGEGDVIACELAEHLAGKRPVEEVNGIYYRDGNEVRKTSAAARVRNISELPWPAWHLVPIEDYLACGDSWGVNRGRNMPIIASRGCPYQCTFCSNPAMWTTRWTVRSPADVLAEMKHYIEVYKATNFDFYDLTAIVKKNWIVEFAKLLIAEDLNITWQLPTGTRSEAIDSDVTPLLVASGCANITYAPESGSDLILAKIKKKIHKSKLLASARSSVKAGCNVKFNFIFGFPGDEYRMYPEVFAFIARCAWIGVWDISIAPFSPYPGSELFNDLQKQGRLPQKLTDDYFRSLLISDASQVHSWSDHMSSSGLNRLRTFALICFYLMSFAIRPWRVFQIIYRFCVGHEESRMDRSLQEMWRRSRVLARGKPDGGLKLSGRGINPY